MLQGIPRPIKKEISMSHYTIFKERLVIENGLTLQICVSFAIVALRLLNVILCFTIKPI